METLLTSSDKPPLPTRVPSAEPAGFGQPGVTKEMQDPDGLTVAIGDGEASMAGSTGMEVLRSPDRVYVTSNPNKGSEDEPLRDLGGVIAERRRRRGQPPFPSRAVGKASVRDVVGQRGVVVDPTADPRQRFSSSAK